MPVSRIGRKGQVVLPKAIREALGVTTGDRVVFSLEGDRVVLAPVPARTAAELRGILRVDRPVDLKEARRAYQEYLAERLGAGHAHAERGPR